MRCLPVPHTRRDLVHGANPKTPDLIASRLPLPRSKFARLSVRVPPRIFIQRQALAAALATALVCGAALRGSTDADGANRATCPVSHVHYSTDTSAAGGLRSIPWIATTPTQNFHAHLFLYGGTPWAKQHLPGARIFTTVKTRPVNPKVLWTAQRPGAGMTLLISGKRLDKPGHFSSRYPSVSPGNQFPSYVEVPQAGCWRITVKSGKLAGAVTFEAVDSF